MWQHVLCFPLTHVMASFYSSLRQQYPLKSYFVLNKVRGGADKFLARPERKTSTETKLGIYSTYSPRSSIHFLARCSNYCKPLKKNQKFVRPTRSPRQQWPPHRTKNFDLFIDFSVQETGDSSTGPDPENRVGDQDIGNPDRPLSSGLLVPGEPRHCRARTRQRWVIIGVDSLALWKIINEEDAVLIQKHRGENFSNGFLHSEFLRRRETLCRHSIECCFVLGS